MGRHSVSDDYEDDPEEPDESDMDGDEGDVEVEECPNCGRAIFEGAEQCPHCGEYVVEKARSGLPTWAVVTCIVLLIVTVLLAVRGF